MAGLALGHLLGSALADNQSTGIARFRTHVDNPVRRFNDVQIVLDHDHAVPSLGKAVEDFQKPVHIGKVQARGGFVENIERFTCAASNQLFGQLDSLSFSA